MNKFYTWPNSSLPFRLYLDHPNCRVFILHNLTHNYDWLEQVKDKIKPTDFFYVTLAWYFSKHLATHASDMFNELNLNKDQFYIMYNDLDEQVNGNRFGFNGDIINHNAWLDENKYTINLSVEKIYDAVYIARRSTMKRHYLANRIENLALVAGGINHKNKICDIPECKNDPGKFLDVTDVYNIINQSRVGLCLSEMEGACWSSGEYLLCGIPVVSTHSRGGRVIWYNIDNSLIVEDTPDAVASGVRQVINRQFSPDIIRQDHIDKQVFFRDKFKRHLFETLTVCNATIDVDTYFTDNFIDKMYTSMNNKDIINIFTS